MRVATYFTVYKDPQYYCGPGPGVVANDDGRLTVAFRRVPSWLEDDHAGHWHPATEACLTRSADGGATWSPPQVFLGGYQCPCLDRLRDGTLVHSTHRMEAVPPQLVDALPDRPGIRRTPWPGIHAGTFIHRSTDGGGTWEAPAQLAAPSIAPLHRRLAPPLAVRGNVLQTASGRLLVSAYTLPPPNRALLFFSDDDGRSWSYKAQIAADCNETFLYETSSGALVAFMRCDSDATYLQQAHSTDGGATWTPPGPLCKGYPACALRLPDGQVLLAYGYRFADGYGLRARLLDEEARLQDDDEIILRDDGAVSDLGYPDAALLPDGRALVVYYINRRTDAADATAPRYIEGCILEG